MPALELMLSQNLRTLVLQRGYEIANTYEDRISEAAWTRSHDARRQACEVRHPVGRAFDRIARSTRHFLEIFDELNRLNIEFVSFRENIDTGGPLGRAMVVIICAIAELERNLIVERIRS